MGKKNLENRKCRRFGKFVLRPWQLLIVPLLECYARKIRASIVYTQMYDVEVIKKQSKREVNRTLNINEFERAGKCSVNR